MVPVDSSYFGVQSAHQVYVRPVSEIVRQLLLNPKKSKMISRLPTKWIASPFHVDPLSTRCPSIVNGKRLLLHPHFKGLCAPSPWDDSYLLVGDVLKLHSGETILAESFQVSHQSIMLLSQMNHSEMGL